MWRGGRERGNSDPIEALAVARAALREPDLPVARLDWPTREVNLLSDHRHHLVVQRSELVNGCGGACVNSTRGCGSPHAGCAATV